MPDQGDKTLRRTPVAAGGTRPASDLGETDHRCPRCGDDFISWACELVCWNCGLKFTCDE